MRPVAVAEVGAGGETLFADGHGVGAARVEATAGGRVYQAGNFAACGQHGQAPARLQAFGVGRDGEQHLRVGVFRVLDDLLAWPTLDHLPCIHG